MIFVTSGTQLPFDRFIKTVDEIAALYPFEKFLVQAIDRKHPIKSTNITLANSLSPGEFTDAVNNAELVISHAGIGSIVSAAQSQKPLIVFPRFGKLKEHRNNHQVATCKALGQQFELNVATNAAELKGLMEKYFEGYLPLLPQIPAIASEQMLDSLRTFIEPEAEVSLV